MLISFVSFDKADPRMVGNLENFLLLCKKEADLVFGWWRGI